MKQLIVFSVFFLALCFVDNSYAQRTENKLIVINLDKDLRNFADPFEAVVIPGDTIQFISVDGDFAIYIENAISFLYVEEVNIKIELTQSNSVSEKYVVRKVENDVVQKSYSIICLTTKGWPDDAPPKIIIVSQ